MSARKNYDVIVVGNGVIALSIAYELAGRARDLSIAVLGPAHRAGAASAAAGAMLNTFGEVTKYTLLSAAGQAKFELTRQALDRWPSWLEELKEVSGKADLDRTLTHGTTVIFNARSGHLDNANFAALQAAFVKFDEPYEEIDPEDIAGLQPVPQARPLRALHAPREGAIDAREVLAGLEAANAARGVTLLDCEVSRVVTRDSRVTGVELKTGETIEAGTVVLAAGSFSGPLTDVFPLGSVPAMFAGKGVAALINRAWGPGFDHVVRTPTRSGACGLHVIPLGNDVEYIGATNSLQHPGQAHVADFGWSEFLLTVARDQLDTRYFFFDIQRWLVGNRPVSVDGFPLIGRTSVAGLVLATGTYRDGFHCSPAIARLVADDLLGVGSLAERLPYFVPERRPIELMTPEQTVREVAFQSASGSFEAGMILPPWNGDTSMLDTHYHLATQRYFDVLGEPIGLPTEVLNAIIFDPDPANHRITKYLQAMRKHYASVAAG